MHDFNLVLDTRRDTHKIRCLPQFGTRILENICKSFTSRSREKSALLLVEIDPQCLKRVIMIFSLSILGNKQFNFSKTYQAHLSRMKFGKKRKICRM